MVVGHRLAYRICRGSPRSLPKRPEWARTNNSNIPTLPHPFCLPAVSVLHPSFPKSFDPKHSPRHVLGARPPTRPNARQGGRLLSKKDLRWFKSVWGTEGKVEVLSMATPRTRSQARPHAFDTLWRRLTEATSTICAFRSRVAAERDVTWSEFLGNRVCQDQSYRPPTALLLSAAARTSTTRLHVSPLLTVALHHHHINACQHQTV